VVHPNIELMRRYSTALQGGQAAEALPFFADDLVLHIPDGQFEPLGVDDILASDTHAATLVRWRVRRGDRTLDIDRVVVYRIVDERIAEIWVRDWDQAAYDELFADAE